PPCPPPRPAPPPGRPPGPVLLRPRRPPDPADGQGHRRARPRRALAQRAARRARGHGTVRLPGHRPPALPLRLAPEQGGRERRRGLQPVLPAHVPADDADGDARLPPPRADAPGGGGRRPPVRVPPVPLP